MKTRKIVVAVAPVAHMEKVIPSGITNPISPQEISREVIDCWNAGASLVHLHVRDETGKQVANLATFSRTIDMIRSSADIILQGSTGGMSSLSLEERSASVNEPRVQMASLNMGSTNFGDDVYINTWNDIRYWAHKMRRNKVVPELEVFDLSMIETIIHLSNEGTLETPLHINFSLGFKGALSASPDNLFRLKQTLPENASWSMLHEGMIDFSLLGVAIGCGAKGIRVGYEDGFYLRGGELASNPKLVEHAVMLIRQMGCEVASVQEAYEMLGIKKY